MLWSKPSTEGATAPQSRAQDAQKGQAMCKKTTGELIAEVTEGAQAVVSPKAAAAFLDCHERTVTRMCEQGKLKAVKVMSMWRINRRALLEFAGLEG